MHRTVAHRLVRTLEAHRLCRRDDNERVMLGTGLVTLAEPVEHDLRTVARPLDDEKSLGSAVVDSARRLGSLPH